jgi:uncharacterized coiled-coil protein SlyX
MSDSIEKLALMVAELMQEIMRLKTEMTLLRKNMLDVKDICRSCAGFQDDGK